MNQQHPIRLREGVKESDIDAFRTVLESSGYFYEFEVEVALDLASDCCQLAVGSEYRFLVAEDETGVAGFACFGGVLCTISTYDIYWVAVHERLRGKGVGSQLMQKTEELIAAAKGTRVYVETAGREQYESTRRFYQKIGYKHIATLPDYYAPGDDKVIMCKVLSAE